MYVYKDIQEAEISSELPFLASCSPKQIIAKISMAHVAGMNGADLDGYFFCCFEEASTISLAALIEAECSVLDNEDSRSGNVFWLEIELEITITIVIVKHYKTHLYCKDNEIT